MPVLREVDYTPDGRRALEALPEDVQEALREALGDRVGESHSIGAH